jgi:hypothetical protein
MRIDRLGKKTSTKHPTSTFMPEGEASPKLLVIISPSEIKKAERSENAN